jgi:hypothetical protein
LWLPFISKPALFAGNTVRLLRHGLLLFFEMHLISFTQTAHQKEEAFYVPALKPGQIHARAAPKASAFFGALFNGLKIARMRTR